MTSSPKLVFLTGRQFLNVLIMFCNEFGVLQHRCRFKTLRVSNGRQIPGISYERIMLNGYPPSRLCFFDHAFCLLLCNVLLPMDGFSKYSGSACTSPPLEMALNLNASAWASLVFRSLSCCNAVRFSSRSCSNISKLE